MKPSQQHLGTLIIALAAWMPHTCRAICDIQFTRSNRFPNVIAMKFSTPGAPAAMAASKESSVRCRYEGEESNEQKYLPPGAYRYSIKDNNGDWSSWTGYGFRENQDHLFTIEWNNPTKSKGKRVNYAFPAFTFSLAEPYKFQTLSYSATFSTTADFTDYRHVNDLTLACPFTDNGVGCSIQVWALVTGSLPANTPAGTKAAFDIRPTAEHNAEVRIKSATNSWNSYWFLPKHDGYVY